MAYVRRRPAKRRRSIVRRRRRFSRAVKRRTLKPTIARSVTSLVPDRFLVKLKYSQQFGMAYAGAGAAAYKQFRVNSIYDPDASVGIGHQPLGHDQWANMYNRYLVSGCAFKITFVNYSTTEQVEVAVNVRPNSTVDTVPETIREGPSNVFKGIVGVEGSGQAIKSCRGYASVCKIRGIPKGRLRYESDYQAQFGNNPPIQCYLNLFCSNIDTTTAANIRARVDLVYYCEFYDRKIQSQS